MVFEGHRDEPFALQPLQLLERCRASAHVPSSTELDAFEEEPRTARGIGQMAALAPASDAEVPGLDSIRSGQGGAIGEWSRLRPVRSLLAQVGLPVPNELDQVAFAALIEALELRGFEVATAEGARLTPLHDPVAIDAELRVRHDELAASQASFLRAAGDRREGLANRGPAELGDYERAALRLELLMAGSDPEQELPELISKAIEIAAAGLVIHVAERSLLERVAAAMARAPRDPVVVLTSLVRRLDSEDGEVLLREFAVLRAADDEMHALLSDHRAALCRSP